MTENNPNWKLFKKSIIEIDEAKTARIERLEGVLEEMLIASKDVLCLFTASDIVNSDGKYDALCRAVSHASETK